MVCHARCDVSKQQIIGAGIFTPTTDAGYSDIVTINPGGSGPTITTNRAELAAVLVAVQKGHTEIATDSASSLFQVRKQLLNPMAVLHTLHRELLKDSRFNPILTLYCHFLQSEIPLWYYWQ
jgi:ribonuclease HI